MGNNRSRSISQIHLPVENNNQNEDSLYPAVDSHLSWATNNGDVHQANDILNTIDATGVTEANLPFTVDPTTISNFEDNNHQESISVFQEPAGGAGDENENEEMIAQEANDTVEVEDHDNSLEMELDCSDTEGGFFCHYSDLQRRGDSTLGLTINVSPRCTIKIFIGGGRGGGWSGR